MTSEDDKKRLRRRFGLFDDADEKDMLWAILQLLSEIPESNIYCAKLKQSLTEAVLLLREHARTVGPQHSWWDFISEAEDLLKERE
jgi:hypothetical protein